MFMRSTTFFALCWRIFASLSTRTYFQPDEFFQSLEVAHHAVFGYAHLTWEWRASPPIRSFIYPLVYTPVYALLKLTGLDGGLLLIAGPKALQGALAAMTDVWVYELAKTIVGERCASVTLFLSITSFFHLLSLGRTLSNSLETSLTTVALCYWPWHDTPHLEKQHIASLSLAALTCMLRPTNAILWLFLFMELLSRLGNDPRRSKLLIYETFAIGVISCILLVIIDSVYFGCLTFTPGNFFLVNLSSVSLFYGRNPWHFYITQALPILCSTCLPFFALGAWSVLQRSSRAERRLLGLIVWTIAVYSFAGHKEWRFIHPLLPPIHVISAKALVDLYHRPATRGEAKIDCNDSAETSKHRPMLPIRRSHWIFLIQGLIPAVYVMYYHSRAQISVMSYLRSLDPDVELKSVGFLMPCHSTPSHAYLHRPHLAEEGRMWAIGCEPPLAGESISSYQDQTDIFYASPVAYLQEHFPRNINVSFPPSPLATTRPGSASPPNNEWRHEWPSHLVLFGALVDEGEGGRAVSKYLGEMGYAEEWGSRNGWESDSRRQGGVRVWAVDGELRTGESAGSI